MHVRTSTTSALAPKGIFLWGFFGVLGGFWGCLIEWCLGFLGGDLEHNMPDRQTDICVSRASFGVKNAKQKTIFPGNS